MKVRPPASPLGGPRSGVGAMSAKAAETTSGAARTAARIPGAFHPPPHVAKTSIACSQAARRRTRSRRGAVFYRRAKSTRKDPPPASSGSKSISIDAGAPSRLKASKICEPTATPGSKPRRSKPTTHSADQSFSLRDGAVRPAVDAADKLGGRRLGRVASRAMTRKVRSPAVTSMNSSGGGAMSARAAASGAASARPIAARRRMRDTLIKGSGFFHSASLVRTMSMSEAEALLISMAIEGPVAFALVALARWPSRGALHVGAAAMIATAVTHPQMWTLAIWSYGRFPYWPAILVDRGAGRRRRGGADRLDGAADAGARRNRLARRQFGVVPVRAVADGLSGALTVKGRKRLVDAVADRVGFEPSTAMRGALHRARSATAPTKRDAPTQQKRLPRGGDALMLRRFRNPARDLRKLRPWPSSPTSSPA